MKTVLTALIVSTAFAAGSAFAEPTLVNDDAWITGPKQSSPAPRGAAGAPKHSMHEAHMQSHMQSHMQARMQARMQTPAQKQPQTMIEILANQPISFGE